MTHDEYAEALEGAARVAEGCVRVFADTWDRIVRRWLHEYAPDRRMSYVRYACVALPLTAFADDAGVMAALSDGLVLVVEAGGLITFFRPAV